MTSIYEGHARIPLEAMLNEKPVVASDVDGVALSFTDGEQGYLVPPGDIETFAQHLLTLLRDPEHCVRMGEKGKLRARDFHPDIVFRSLNAALATR